MYWQAMSSVTNQLGSPWTQTYWHASSSARSISFPRVKILWWWPSGLWLWESISHIWFEILLMAPCVTRVIRTISNCRCPSQWVLSYFKWNVLWHCLNFATCRPKRRFYQWDSSKSNPIRHLNWLNTLTSNTSNESAHWKLHEIYLMGNSLLNQATSRNWGHMFGNQLQSIQSIFQSVKLKMSLQIIIIKNIPMNWPAVYVAIQHEIGNYLWYIDFL